MAKQTINIGSSANKGDGDPLRTAFTKVNENFTELYARAENTDSQTLTLAGNTLSISGGNSVVLNVSPTGDLTGSVFADDSTLLVDGVNGKIVGDIETNSLVVGGGLLGQVWGDGIDTELTLKSPPGVGDSGYVALSSANERNYVEVSNIGVVLAVEFNTEGFKTLTFGTDGKLTAPGEVYAQFYTIRGGGGAGEEVGNLGYGGNTVVLFGTEGVNIEAVSEGGPQWKFGTDGSLQIPGDIRSENAISIDINLSDSTLRRWTFGEDGELTFPDSTVQNTAYPGIVSTHSGQDRIEVGGTPATMDGLSVRIVSSTPGANEVEINYQPAGTEAIGVNRYGTNVFNGIEIIANGNTSWFNIDNFDTIGDGTEFTVTDYSGKIYRVTVIMANITTTSPTVVTGDAYCVIERLK